MHSPGTVIIRRMVASDLEKVAVLYRTILLPSYISFSELAEGKAVTPRELHPSAAAIFQRQMNALVHDEQHGFFVAETGGAIIGFVLASIHLTEAGHYECWIDDLGVAFGARRAGLGQDLVSRAVEWGESKGVRYFLLESGIDNHEAHQLFSYLGFEPISTVFWRPVPELIKKA